MVRAAARAVTVLVILFALSGCAATPPTPSDGAATACRNTSASAGKTVYAWFPARFGTWWTDRIPWTCLTHISFRSVVVQAGGTLRYPAGDPPRRFVEAAHRHGVKVTVLVWVDRRQDSDGYLARFPERTAKNLLAYVERNHLDGVNIDDERMAELNTVAGTPNRDLVTRFFRILAETFRAARPDYHITFAAPPIISKDDRYATPWLDLKAIADVVDGIIPMGYTQNPPSIGWTTNPEPVGGGGRAAHTTTRDLRTMVRDYLAAMGGRPEKLLPGVSLAFGGYEWRARTDRPLAPTIARGVPLSLRAAEARAQAHGRRWDEEQRSPWYVYRDGDVFVQGWYNDLAAWKAKLDWIDEQHLGGIGIWVLDGVHDPPERWEALRHYWREK